MNISQAPHATTLLSALKAAYEYYYHEPINDALLFGLSGHGFVTAFSKGVGPCAPYTWNMDEFKELCKNNLGLSILEAEHPINPKATDEKKQTFIQTVKQYLDQGTILLLISYEYQLITSYNDTHFITTKPWDAPSVTPDIDINTLKGMKDFLIVSPIHKATQVDIKTGIKNSISFALNQFNEIETEPFISQGIQAFDYLLSQLNEENSSGQGMWWSMTVWAECRHFVSSYMTSLKEYIDRPQILDDLSHLYTISEGLFKELSNRELGLARKVELVHTLKQNEAQTQYLLEKLYQLI